MRGAFNECGQREADNDAVRSRGIWIVVQRRRIGEAGAGKKDPWLVGNDAQPRKESNIRRRVAGAIKGLKDNTSTSVGK
jgi:hypothetical protein